MKELEVEKFKLKIEELTKDMNNDSLEYLSDLFSKAEGKILVLNDPDMVILYKFIQSSMLDSEDKRKEMFKIMKSFDRMEEADRKIRKILYRVYADYVDENVVDALKECFESGVSVYTFLVYSKYFARESEKVILNFSQLLNDIGETGKSVLFLNVAHKMYDQNALIVVSLAEKYISLGMMNEANILINSFNKEIEGK